MKYFANLQGFQNLEGFRQGKPDRFLKLVRFSNKARGYFFEILNITYSNNNYKNIYIYILNITLRLCSVHRILNIKYYIKTAYSEKPYEYENLKN
ncbi:MAG: hypothetical protein A2046_16495 [Bacteroidetes bacterium GWA2_30_7]|nr:MAG: hypothetical protein A2046_16495 [Bacteroidetes bacterium GWA2_30_7]